MKKGLVQKISAALFSLTVLAGCDDVFNDKDIKTNPNAVTDAPYDVLISAAEVGLMTLSQDTDVRIAMIWAGQLTGTGRQHLTFAKYQVSSAVWGWGTYYNTLVNARQIQEKTKPFNNRGPLGIAQVIEALVMTKLTTLWGDVPYSEALDIDNIAAPKYDTQASIYTAVLKLLDEAIANLDSGVGNYGKAVDFLGGKDPEKWSQVAHTLKARLLLHQKKYDEAITETIQGVESTDMDMLSPHGGSFGVDQNWNNSFFTINRPGDTGFSYSEDNKHTFLPTVMEGRVRGTFTNDSALYNHYFTDKLITGGLDPNTDDGMFTADAPHPVMTFYENMLIRAEAYARLGDLDKARDALNAVRAELNTGYINGKTIDEKYREHEEEDEFGDIVVIDDLVYKPFPDAVLTTQTDMLKEILTTKYIVMLGQYEAYTDVRRAAKETPAVTLGIPIYPGTGATAIPERYLIPQNEINTNPNTPSPVPGINTPMIYY